MKFLLVLLVVLGGVWLWKRNRAEQTRQESPPPVTPSGSVKPSAMVACAHCGVHLPAVDAVAGRLGHYCSTEHQRQHEGRT